MMKKLLVIASAVLSLVIIYSCSDSNSAGDAKIIIGAEMINPLVNSTIQVVKNGQIQANEVDSIKVTMVRILTSRMKLYRSSEDTTSGRELKAGPFVYDVDSRGNLVELASGNVPAGNYDKIKLEVHRFSSSELSQYANNAVFSDFATQDRYTIIISGRYYKNNTPTDFIFKSKLDANVLLKYEPAINLPEGTTTTISIQIDPKQIFIRDGSILNPTDAKNTNDIENALLSRLQSVRK